MKACFQIAERSFSSAKIQIIFQKASVFLIINNISPYFSAKQGDI